MWLRLHKNPTDSLSLLRFIWSPPPLHPSIHPSIHLSVHLYVCPSIYLFPSTVARLLMCASKHWFAGSFTHRHIHLSLLLYLFLHSAGTCCLMCGLCVLHQVIGDCHPVKAAYCVRQNSIALTQSDSMGSSPISSSLSFLIYKMGTFDSSEWCSCVQIF